MDFPVGLSVSGEAGMSPDDQRRVSSTQAVGKLMCKSRMSYSEADVHYDSKRNRLDLLLDLGFGLVLVLLLIISLVSLVVQMRGCFRNVVTMKIFEVEAMTVMIK